jgi:hypothetical protein
MAIEVEASWRAMKAREMLRTRAEGHGRPMISTDFKDHRIVAVGNRIYYDRNWRFFTDFLLFHMKDVLGRGWGTKMGAQGDTHPLFKWLRQMNHAAQKYKAPEGDMLVACGEGVAIAVFRFAYALYLIAHHDQIPPTLIRRLRQPNEFLSAVVETIAFATFALAGAKLEMGETQKGAGPEGEFRATSIRSGRTYDVEAKRKNGWSSQVDIANPDFRRELTIWLERKLRDASSKRLTNPVFWFELSIPNVEEMQQTEALQLLLRTALREAEERILIDGERPGPAYVFITSHGFLAGGDASCLYMLEGFHIPMHVNGEQVEIELAMDERDRDRDVLWIFDCIRKVQMIPHRFDGQPDDLISPDHEPIVRLRVGQRLEVTTSDQQFVKGLVIDVLSNGPNATIRLMEEATGKQRIVQLPLTEKEQKAAAVLGDAVFGNPDQHELISEKDPLGFYDFFLKVYANTPREKLLEFISNHLESAAYSKLSTEALRIRVCREWTKSALAQAAFRPPSDGAADDGTTAG